MTSLFRTSLKEGIFGVVMLLVTAALFATFGQFRTASDNRYTAMFDDVSSLITAACGNRFGSSIR